MDFLSTSHQFIRFYIGKVFSIHYVIVRFRVQFKNNTCISEFFKDTLKLHGRKGQVYFESY